MGQVSFGEMAEALREVVRTGVILIARLEMQTQLVGLIDFEEMAGRKEAVNQAAKLIADLTPHEILVRELARVGALVDFPTFTNNVTGLRPQDIVLLRAIVTDSLPAETEVQIMLTADRLTNRVWVRRGDIVGVEKRPAASTILAVARNTAL